MKTFRALLLGLVLLSAGGCVIGPPEPAGVSVGVYGEYPAYAYGYYPYSRWHHPYDRDHYFYRYPHHYYWYR